MEITKGVAKQGSEFAILRNLGVDHIDIIMCDRDPSRVGAIEIETAGINHRFERDHPLTRTAHLVGKDRVRELIDGGTGIVVDDKLVEFRPSTYDGFIHSNEAVFRMMEQLGVRERDSRMMTRAQMRNTMRNANSALNTVRLGTIWSENDFDIPMYHDGGAFTSRLVYEWSMFNNSISASMQLVRQICTNGMVGVGNWFNNQIPMINRWEEHLQIANRQIQNHIQIKATQRMVEMGKSRASVADLMLISEHADKRLDHLLKEQEKGNSFSVADFDRLTNLKKVADPLPYVGHIYSADALDDRQVCSLIPAHVTTFDAWNLVTELLTHTPGCPSSTFSALQRIANHMVFDGDTRAKRVLPSGIRLASFSDPRTAFFGAVAA